MKEPHQKDLNRAAMIVLETLQEHEKHLNSRLDNKKGDIKGWINLSWSIERELVKKSIDKITQDIINQKYDY